MNHICSFILSFFIATTIFGLAGAEQREPKKDLRQTKKYRQWVRQLRKKWQDEDISSNVAQKDDLVNMIEPVVHIKKIPAQIRRNALFAYSFLISEFLDECAAKCAQVSSIKDIKKDEVLAGIKRLHENELSLIWGIFESLEKRSATDDAEQKRYHESNALSWYNELREQWRQPKIANCDEIDRQWLDVVQLYLNKESRDLIEASPLDYALLKKVQATVGNKEQIFLGYSSKQSDATSFPSGNMHVIALREVADFDRKLYTIYHELSHVVNKDQLIQWRVNRNIMSASDFLLRDDVKKDRERIENCIELGKTAFDPNTREGKLVKRILKEYKTFWHKPDDENIALKHEIKRTHEQRADIFAYDKLFEHHDENALLYKIATFGWGYAEYHFSVNTFDEAPNFSTYIVSEGTDDPHSSWFERVLYTAGFLVSKGIDVSKALEEYRNNGVCRDVEASLEYLYRHNI